jgi:hypothetical protein
MKDASDERFLTGVRVTRSKRTHGGIKTYYGACKIEIHINIYILLRKNPNKQAQN